MKITTPFGHPHRDGHGLDQSPAFSAGHRSAHHDLETAMKTGTIHHLWAAALRRLRHTRALAVGLAVAAAVGGALFATHSGVSVGAVADARSNASASVSWSAGKSGGNAVVCDVGSQVFEKRFVLGIVKCTAPVDKIDIDVWGENKSGATTWGTLSQTCLGTDYCDLDAAAGPGDAKVTICGTSELFGVVGGDCIDVNGPFAGPTPPPKGIINLPGNH